MTFFGPCGGITWGIIFLCWPGGITTLGGIGIPGPIIFFWWPGGILPMNFPNGGWIGNLFWGPNGRGGIFGLGATIFFPPWGGISTANLGWPLGIFVAGIFGGTRGPLGGWIGFWIWGCGWIGILAGWIGWVCGWGWGLGCWGGGEIGSWIGVLLTCGWATWGCTGA